MKVMQTEW